MATLPAPSHPSLSLVLQGGAGILLHHRRGGEGVSRHRHLERHHPGEEEDQVGHQVVAIYPNPTNFGISTQPIFGMARGGHARTIGGQH